MFRVNLVAAFILTLITYGLFFAFQRPAPLSQAETLVVFAFWFGLTALFRWIAGKRKAKQ